MRWKWKWLWSTYISETGVYPGIAYRHRESVAAQARVLSGAAI
jgi:hypothetical protein